MITHPLLVFSRPDQDRVAVASWVRGALAADERVVFRLAPGVADVTGDDSDAGGGIDVATLSDELVRAGLDRAVIDSGQVQFLDVLRLAGATGGRACALREACIELVVRARHAGYTGLAVTGDGATLRASTCDELEMQAHGRDLDRLTRELPLHVLCRYRSGERPALLACMAAVHHRSTTDLLWDVELVDGCLSVCGEIDISNADRFAAVLHAARLDGTRCVDVSGPRFCAAAGLGVLAAAGASSPADRPLILRNASRPLARLLRTGGVDGTGIRIEIDEGDAGCAAVAGGA